MDVRIENGTLIDVIVRSSTGFFNPLAVGSNSTRLTK
jgi:hypothetical protein